MGQVRVFFLDDENNPLTLRFRIGIDAFKGRGGGFAAMLGKKLPTDRDTLQVIELLRRQGLASRSRRTRMRR